MLENIKFAKKVADNQEDLFSPCHIKYRCVIKNNGKRFTFDFQCNKKHDVKIEDVLDCLLLDASAYEQSADILDFSNEFGYKSYKEAEKAFNGCKRTYNALNRLFNESELNMLQDEIYNI